MKTYQFTAFQNQRYAANGEVKADSPEEAKAKILERYHDGGWISMSTWRRRAGPFHFDRRGGRGIPP